MRDKGKEENKTRKHNITGTFFHTEEEQEQRLNLAADPFKTMGFNSHIHLFCSHWHGVGKWNENTAEGQNIFSPLFLPLLISKLLSVYF